MPYQLTLAGILQQKRSGDGFVCRCLAWIKYKKYAIPTGFDVGYFCPKRVTNVPSRWDYQCFVPMGLMTFHELRLSEVPVP